MSRKVGYRVRLIDAEEELKRAHLAARAGVKGAEQRLARAEIEVEKWRRAVRGIEDDLRKDFGPEGQP